uniref:Uncharacterized protein n=1 Tax=Pyxicephalus adspersus TaxID=30357 RepID=A0AAV3B0X5_PYXAD|nr:TPA: hypothetical protein GDO54_000750 [Pyxicephalus adspersus]
MLEKSCRLHTADLQRRYLNVCNTEMYPIVLSIATLLYIYTQYTIAHLMKCLSIIADFTNVMILAELALVQYVGNGVAFFFII